jgi:hypothetical protein
LETVNSIAQLVAALGGFRDYLEATKPMAEAVPLSELIRGKS